MKPCLVKLLSAVQIVVVNNYSSSCDTAKSKTIDGSIFNLSAIRQLQQKSNYHSNMNSLQRNGLGRPTLEVLARKHAKTKSNAESTVSI